MRTYLRPTATRLNRFGVLPVVLAAIMLALAGVLFAAAQEPAGATFPGSNGKIVFDGARSSVNRDIYAMNPDGSGRIRLTNNAADDFNPTVSADGKRIAFSSDRDGNYEIYVMNVDGFGETRLTNVDEIEGSDCDPTYSPDGTRIAFERAVGEIFVMNANDGSNQTDVSGDPATDDGFPDWRPRPCTISGDSGPNELNGTPANDVICGEGDTDTLRGLGGNDVIRGGIGDDILYGGTGRDRVFGEAGDDRRVHTRDGVRGNDLAFGGTGLDTCVTDPQDERVDRP